MDVEQLVERKLVREADLFEETPPHHKFGMTSPGIENKSLWSEAGDYPSGMWYSILILHSYM
jgi:hypothetical protein